MSSTCTSSRSAASRPVRRPSEVRPSAQLPNAVMPAARPQRDDDGQARHHRDARPGAGDGVDARRSSVDRVAADRVFQQHGHACASVSEVPELAAAADPTAPDPRCRRSGAGRSGAGCGGAGRARRGGVRRAGCGGAGAGARPDARRLAVAWCLQAAARATAIAVLVRADPRARPGSGAAGRGVPEPVAADPTEHQQARGRGSELRPRRARPGRLGWDGGRHRGRERGGCCLRRSVRLRGWKRGGFCRLRCVILRWGGGGRTSAGSAGACGSDGLADGSHRDPLLGRSLLTVLLDVRFEHRGWPAGTGWLR